MSQEIDFLAVQQVFKKFVSQPARLLSRILLCQRFSYRFCGYGSNFVWQISLFGDWKKSSQARSNKLPVNQNMQTNEC